MRHIIGHSCSNQQTPENLNNNSQLETNKCKYYEQYLQYFLNIFVTQIFNKMNSYEKKAREMKKLLLITLTDKINNTSTTYKKKLEMLGKWFPKLPAMW